MPHLAVYGHVNLDLILQLRHLPQPNTTVEITERQLLYGGTAGNIAAVAAHLGAKVKLASFVGEDFPQHYRDHLTKLGIDLTELKTKKHYGTPTWWGFTDPDHNVMGIMDQGPMRDITKFELLTDCLDDAQYAHFGTGRPAYYKRVADEALKRDVPVVLDPGQELKHLYKDQDLEGLLERARLFIVNDHEMETALDKMGYGDPFQLFDHDLDAVIETRGAGGILLHTPKGKTKIPAAKIPTDDVLDTTGAGDSFRGGLHAALQEGKDLTTACRWGAASAAITIQHVGGQTHLPKRQDVQKRLRTIETEA